MLNSQGILLYNIWNIPFR